MSDQEPKHIPTPAELRAAGFEFDEELQRWRRPRRRRVVHDLGPLTGPACDPDLIPHLNGDENQ